MNKSEIEKRKLVIEELDQAAKLAKQMIEFIRLVENINKTKIDIENIRNKLAQYPENIEIGYFSEITDVKINVEKAISLFSFINP